METIVLILGWSAWGLGALGALAFLATTLQERKPRSARRVALVSTPVLVGWALLLSIPSPVRGAILLSLVAGLVALALAAVLPWGKLERLRVPGPRRRLDEREGIFHRFFRLRPGRPEFDEWYRLHPEQREIDEVIRTLPGLCEPGSRSHGAPSAAFAPAVFDVLEKFSTDADWEAPETPRYEASTGEFTTRTRGFARHLGADLIGIANLDPAWVYSHIGRSPGEWGAPIELGHEFAVAIGVEMRHEMIRHAPWGPVITETALRYFDAARVAMILARWMHRMGYAARAHVDGNYRVLCPPVAADAGLGELGRMGLLMSPRFGPSMRLAVVTTDMPLEPDEPIAFGVQHLCSICKKCAEVCPSGAIDGGEKAVHDGVVKWRSDQEKCFRYWCVQGTDCSSCIQVCPYSHPRTPLHQLVRWAIRRNPLARRLALWGDDLFYGRRPEPVAEGPPWHLRGDPGL